MADFGVHTEYLGCVRGENLGQLWKDDDPALRIVSSCCSLPILIDYVDNQWLTITFPFDSLFGSGTLLVLIPMSLWS